MPSIDLYELEPALLKNEHDPARIKFATTDEVTSDAQTIGQERALAAIEFALGNKADGFNLYVAGLPGTGRTSAVLERVRRIASTMPPPDDICYLYNFEQPDEPLAVRLKAGEGCGFKRDCEQFVKKLEGEIIKIFRSEEYDKHKKVIVENFSKKEEDFKNELQSFAHDKGLSLRQTLVGLAAVPVRKGHPISESEFERLSDQDKDRIKDTQEEVYEKLHDLMRKIKDEQFKYEEEMKKLDREIVLYAIGSLIEDLKKKYAHNPVLAKHFDDIRDNVLKNVDVFKKEPQQEQALLLGRQDSSKESVLAMYGVNLLVDNCKATGAPVIIEDNPTFYNITGYTEYKAQMGALLTDFTMIKAGSAHKANGGFLIIQMNQLMQHYFAWDSLKRILRYKTIKIEDLAHRYGYAPATGLKLKPVDVKLKVIIVCNPHIFYLLYDYDEDFRKLFKVRADFSVSMERTDDFIDRYASVIASTCKRLGLLAFTRSAVAKIIDYASRLSSHKQKLSAQFMDIADVMSEADYWARLEHEPRVEDRYVAKALEQKVYRSSMIDERIKEMIKENTLVIDTEGRATGQVNGISVFQLGDYAFGKPSRITARTHVGRGTIVNIERETHLSGNIHSKGVLTLSGYLGEKYAQDKPLALSASITFEQLYDGVEGDSASCAELCCLLSSLADVPLRQDIAITGSIDQRGMVQAIGGINEKIEGVYEICRIKGLTGSQGVIMPDANVKHLMLKDEVVEAVKNGKFHIYAVKNVDEALEILTGTTIGLPDYAGNYPEGRLNWKVNEKLRKYADISSHFAGRSHAHA